LSAELAGKGNHLLKRSKVAVAGCQRAALAAWSFKSAPEPYCEGLTEDGCELMWQPVETVEGDLVDQCVAYCPWQ